MQGPSAQHVLQCVLDDEPNLTNLGFMESTQDLMFMNDDVIVTRCGYTGEDGFEVSVANHSIEAFTDKLLNIEGDKGVKLAHPAGLGARDTLRLEAGLCLYGQEMDENVSPI